MLIIQSFFPNTDDLRSNLSAVKKQSLISCKFLKKHGYDVVLYTTQSLKDKHFINHPYTDVLSIDLTNYASIINPKYFWSITKLICILLQQKPCYHVDTDVFFIEDKISHLKSSPILTLHSEPWAYELIKKHLNLPIINQTYNLNINNYLLSYNFGIFGGQNIELIQKSINKLLNINQNIFTFNNIFLHTDTSYFTWIPSVFLEQMVLPTYIQNYETISTVVDATLSTSFADVFKILRDNNIIHLWSAKGMFDQILGIEKFCDYIDNYYF